MQCLSNQIMDFNEDLMYLKLTFVCLQSTSPWGRAGDISSLERHIRLSLFNHLAKFRATFVTKYRFFGGEMFRSVALRWTFSFHPSVLSRSHSFHPFWSTNVQQISTFWCIFCFVQCYGRFSKHSNENSLNNKNQINFRRSGK